MFEGIKFNFRLLKLQRQRSKVKAFYNKANIEARKKGESREELEGIWQEERMELVLIDDDISHLISQRLLSLAEEYLLPRPEFKEEGKWIESKVNPNSYRLSPLAISELRSAVRKEQKERYEHIFMWLAAITGIIGAISGLVAVIGSK